MRCRSEVFNRILLLRLFLCLSWSETEFSSFRPLWMRILIVDRCDLGWCVVQSTTMTSRLLVDNICSPKTDVHHNSSKLIDPSSEFRRVGDKSPLTSRWATVCYRVVDCRHTELEYTPIVLLLNSCHFLLTKKKEWCHSFLWKSFPFNNSWHHQTDNLHCPSIPPCPHYISIKLLNCNIQICTIKRAVALTLATNTSIT